MKYTFRAYLKDHLIEVVFFFGFFLLLLLMLGAFRVPFSLGLAISILTTTFGLSLLFYGYFRKRNFYREVSRQLADLDQKYLISELLPSPNFLEGKVLASYLYEACKSMNEKIHDYRKNVEDFKDYIELWIHEVKIPISSSKLITYNTKDKEIAKLDTEIDRIQRYVEQVLYYVRSENAEKDYLIKPCSLKEIIHSVLLRNKDRLLYQGMSITLENVELEVLSDGKWLEYILGQIVDNSIKYARREDAVLLFRGTETEDTITLEIVDHGIGIKESELSYVFQKSFTGTNGHISKVSTGMGLYIVKKLCEKLGHKITITSEENVYTKVTLTFLKTGYYDVID